MGINLSENNERNLPLEALRGIAIICVVLYHFFYRYFEIFHDSNGAVAFFSRFGEFGVAIFFVLSGFCLVPRQETSANDYLIKRFLRLWPMYAVCITIVFLITRFIELEGRTCSIKQYLLNLFFLNGFLGLRYVDGAHWYLTILVYFIILEALLIIIKKKDNIFFYWAWLLIGFPFYKKIVDGYFFYKIVGNTYIGYVVGGIAISLFVKNKCRKWSFFVSIGLCLFFEYITRGWINAIFYLIASLSVYLCINKKIEIRYLKHLVYIGKMEYSWYLIHTNIGFILINEILSWLNCWQNIYSVCLLAFFVTAVIGFGLYRLVEVRFFRGKR